MCVSLKGKIINLLREVIDKLDAGTSEITEEEAVAIMKIVCHHALSKADACRYLNLSRSRFDDLVRMGKVPKGKKRTGFKELVWYEDELKESLKRIKG